MELLEITFDVRDKNNTRVVATVRYPDGKEERRTKTYVGHDIVAISLTIARGQEILGWETV